jgi:hypothetical protein
MSLRISCLVKVVGGDTNHGGCNTFHHFLSEKLLKNEFANFLFGKGGWWGHRPRRERKD